MKKIYFMLAGILLVVILVSGCMVEKDIIICETDSDCKHLEKTECIDDEIISPSALCVDGVCICTCGYKDSEGRFIGMACE